MPRTAWKEAPIEIGLVTKRGQLVRGRAPTVGQAGARFGAWKDPHAGAAADLRESDKADKYIAPA